MGKDLTQALLTEIAVLKAQLAERSQSIQQREQQIAHLEQQIEVLKKLCFGPRSEKQPQAVDAALTCGGKQSFLFVQEIAAAAMKLAEDKQVQATVELRSAGTPARRKGRRSEFPSHLPRVTTTLELPVEQRVCCGQPMVEMGQETTRTLERVETFVVHEIARKKYACRICQEKVKLAPGPDRVIDKSILGTGALAHVITERFGNHLPYHRLEKKYAAEGLDLSRSVLCRSSLACAEILAPIWKQMVKEVAAKDFVQTDDTPVVLEESSTGARKTARFWIYHDLEDRHVYDFTESRSRDGPMAILAGLEGFVQADAFPGFDVFFQPGSKILEVGCWAHARRYFKRALDSEKADATEAMAIIRQLYVIERAAKEQSLATPDVLRLRIEKSLPVLLHFKEWLEVARTRVLDKGPMAKAIHYTLSNWAALTRYTTDGRLPIDNNDAERALRAVAVGRKNWMQIGTVRGGKDAAVLYSLVQTCKAIGIDPRTYLRDVLERIAKESDVTKLTPHGWKQHFAAQVAADHDRVFAAAVVAG